MVFLALAKDYFYSAQVRFELMNLLNQKLVHIAAYTTLGIPIGQIPSVILDGKI